MDNVRTMGSRSPAARKGWARHSPRSAPARGLNLLLVARRPEPLAETASTPARRPQGAGAHPRGGTSRSRATLALIEKECAGLRDRAARL